MKKYLSVFSLYISSTFTKILAVILLMAGTQLGLFIHILNSEEIITSDSLTETEFLLGIELILKNNRAMTFIFAAGFLLITVILALNGCKYTSRDDYTLRRLKINEKKAIICKALYGIFPYYLLIIAEALILFIICNIYVSFAKTHPNAFEGLISNQTIFLAFYRSSLLHSVLPLEDILKHVSTFTGILGMSFSTAFLSYFLRRKKLFLETFILIPIIIINFTATWTAGFANDLMIMGVSCFILGILTVRISTEEQAYDI